MIIKSMRRSRVLKCFILDYLILIIIIIVLKLFVKFIILVQIGNYSSNDKRMRNFFPQVIPRPNDSKYILQWTTFINDDKYFYVEFEHKIFENRRCRFKNCYFTSDRSFFDDVSKFDAVLFVGQDIFYMPELNLPANRSLHQKYVFATIESDINIPLCSDHLDGVFNWTWTYKLDSDAKAAHFVVREANGNVIGPNKDMHWIKKEEMLPVTNKLKKALKRKKKAVAWIQTDCFTFNNRDIVVKNLGKSLAKYNLSVDIYGDCEYSSRCPKSNEEECYKMLKKDYHFHLSFETSFSNDYVTKIVLNAILNNVVPIVYGGANYSRFLPEGSFLDALALGSEVLAAKINESMHDLDLYSDYFRWKSHYYYEKRGLSAETDDYCEFCALLNNEDKVREIKVYENFREWWDSDYSCSYLKLLHDQKG